MKCGGISVIDSSDIFRWNLTWLVLEGLSINVVILDAATDIQNYAVFLYWNMWNFFCHVVGSSSSEFLPTTLGSVYKLTYILFYGSYICAPLVYQFKWWIFCSIPYILNQLLCRFYCWWEIWRSTCQARISSQLWESNPLYDQISCSPHHALILNFWTYQEKILSSIDLNAKMESVSFGVVPSDVCIWVAESSTWTKYTTIFTHNLYPANPQLVHSYNM